MEITRQSDKQKAVQAFDQVRCPREGLPIAWALPRNDFIKNNRNL